MEHQLSSEKYLIMGAQQTLKTLFDLHLKERKTVMIHFILLILEQGSLKIIIQKGALALIPGII